MASRQLLGITGFVHLVTFCVARIDGTAPFEAVRSGTRDPSLPDGNDFANYPQCAQACSNVTVPGVPGEAAAAPQVCLPASRATFVSCEAVQCTEDEFEETQELAADVCSGQYAANTTLVAEVNSAVSSATSAVLAVPTESSPTSQSSYPQCAQQCQNQAFAAGACSSVADVKCVCGCPTFNEIADPCERANCTVEELFTIQYLAFNLCDSNGATELNPNKYAACNSNSTSPAATGSNGVSPTLTGGPSKTSPITPFTGKGASLKPSMTTLVVSLVGVGLALAQNL